MASLVDLSSSPDPLGDEAPSSIRTITRRTARNLKSNHRESSLQVPSSIKPRSSVKSPRKQTFELDVGNGRSPQRLLVTVEAEDERGRRSGVNRRLFSASPSRSLSRRREETTTTVIPLRGLTDDEGGGLGDDPTPRRRGRPRGSLGSRNGTPGPRGKKRAGTPLQPTSRAKRHSAEIPLSDATLASDALMEASGNSNPEPTPKPKARMRKTPKKASTPALPSSKATGRKRGRPRKALMPEEVAGLTSEAGARSDDTHVNHGEELSTIREAHSEGGSQLQRSNDALNTKVHGAALVSPRGPEDTIQGFSSRRELRRSPEPSNSFAGIEDTPAHAARTGQFDQPMFDDFTGEQHSDFESEADDADAATYSGQDNLTHASEFSMIAVEELPSFQASFQGNRSGLTEVPPRFAEAGDETNLIINQTLESLRRSTQSEARNQSNHKDIHQAEVNEALPAREHEPRGHVHISPSNLGSSQLSWTRSPRRQQKVMPLSKQVLLNRAPHVDDSFSSIPDSILQAATPGRLPMKPAATHVADRDENMYEDSFSEIPDEVLTAATPKPARPAMQLDQADLPSPEGETQSATRSTNIGSDRLPTPDDTNSSATDAKNGHGEDAQRLVIGSTAPVNTSDLNIRSSPPTISRQFNTMNIQSESAHTISRHFDTMALQSEQSEQSRADQTMAGTPPRETSSPHLGLANSGSAENAQMLQPPQHGRRPTLSPIVRAGRTLQNILSDRSSPDEQGSLGSPFRGSLQSNSRQSSLSRSPARAASHRRTGSDSRALFSSMALSQSIRSAFGSSQRASSLPAPDLAPALLPVPEPAALPVQTENSSRPNMLDSSHIEMSRRPDQGFEHGQTNGLIDRPETNPEAPSSSRVALPSEQGHHQETSSGFGQEDLSSPATQRSRRISASLRAANSSAFGKRGFRSSQLRDIVSESDSGLEEENIEEQDEQIEEEQVEEETTEPIDGHDEEVIESQEEQHEEEHIFDDILDQEDSLEIDRDNGQEVADQGGSEREQQETVSGETSFDVEDDDGDDVDLWDIEASRPTPRANKIRQSQVQVGVLHPAPAAPVPAAPAAVDADPPRPAKITSPWRRNARRLIYQDEFRSPSEIEMEDSPPSVIGRATSVPQTDAERASPLPQVKPKQVSSRSQIEVERAHPAPPRGGQQERVIEASPEPPQKEIDMEQEQTGEDYEVEYSHELMEREESDEPQEPPQALNQMKRKAPLVEHSVVQEYSMAEGNQAEEEQEPEQPAPARRSFFGRGFDILSFFSSPRPPPTTNDPPRTQVDETPVHRTTAKPLPRSVQSIQNSLPEEPQSALRATGLFPSIRQKIFNPSPERRVDLFSPGTALRSNDTVADTYDEAPSTPEQLEFDSIPQKRNFTPLSGQSRNTASLFTPSRQGSTPAQELRTPSSEYDDFREKDFSDEAEESGFTDGPSFEHIPPREKPSHWDKNLSPTKSCMRSPLKPKTPGRVVEFTSTVLSPRAQEKARVDRQRVLNTVSNVSVNIATNNPRTAIINPSPLRIPPSYQSREYNKENTISPSKSPGRQFNQSAPATRPQAAAAAKLSPTSWTRAHWMRLDEILQLRKRDPMQFQMYFPSVAPYKHPLAGLEVAAQDAKMVLEDWHLEVVEAFRAELTAAASKSFGENEEETNDAWDDKALSKRLFALMVGEERRRSGKYVSGRAGNSRQG